VAKLLTDPVFEVKAEDAAFTGSDVTFGAGTLTARTIGTLLSMSRELAEDAPNIGPEIERILGVSLGVEIDRLSLLGNGGGDGVLGLVNVDGIPATGSVGAIAWADFHAAVVAVRESNYMPNAYIVSPTIGGDLDLITSGDGANSAKLWLGPPPSLDGVRRLETTAIGNAQAVTGQFDRAIFGFRTGATIEVSNIAQSAFEKHQVKVKITQRFDFLVLRKEAFHVLNGITT
jgi:HK97 family phage major capsid protein